MLSRKTGEEGVLSFFYRTFHHLHRLQSAQSMKISVSSALRAWERFSIRLLKAANQSWIHVDLLRRRGIMGVLRALHPLMSDTFRFNQTEILRKFVGRTGICAAHPGVHCFGLGVISHAYLVGCLFSVLKEE